MEYGFKLTHQDGEQSTLRHARAFAITQPSLSTHFRRYVDRTPDLGRDSLQNKADVTNPAAQGEASSCYNRKRYRPRDYDPFTWRAAERETWNYDPFCRTPSHHLTAH